MSQYLFLPFLIFFIHDLMIVSYDLNVGSHKIKVIRLNHKQAALEVYDHIVTFIG